MSATSDTNQEFAVREAGGGGRRWSFWIDRGGTFTDIVARGPEGVVVTHKLLVEKPRQYEGAALQGLREVLGTGRGN